MNKTTKKLMQSFIIVPLLTTTMSMSNFTSAIDQSIDNPAKTELSETDIALQKEREIKAAKINAYYAKYDLPLEGYGMQMVLTAEKYDLDPYLLPAIAMQETTGGKFACYKNAFGYGSCKIKFESFEQGIDMVGKSIGGHNPKTARYYQGKTVIQKLQTYNPPHIAPKYAYEVMAIMKKIEKMPV